MLMRLNLDKVTHPIHCYYPASGKKYFDRLRYGTIYHETINVIEHPVSAEGIVHDDGKFKIEAYYLEHGVDNLGWRITEPDVTKFYPERLRASGVRGPLVKELEKEGFVTVDGKVIRLEDVSWVRHGDVLAVVIDTRFCEQAIEIARDAKVLICESTYLEADRDLAHKHFHLTAKQAAQIAKEANAQQLILTHFSARYQDLFPFVAQAKEIFENVDVAEDLKRFEFPR